MKAGMRNTLIALVLGGFLVGLGTGCATPDRKVTIIEDSRNATTTVVREDAKEKNTTIYHKPVITEPTPVVASDADFR